MPEKAAKKPPTTARNKPIVGRLVMDRQGAPCVEPMVQPDSDLPRRMYLKSAPDDLSAGGYVAFSLQLSGGVAHACFEQRLGAANTPGIEAKIAALQHGISWQWPAEPLAQATALPEQILAQDHAGRADLRHLPFFTIDDVTARDHDDALYCERHGTGGWRLWVAIADVAHYVQPESPLDKAALQRGCSVYFPSTVVPMLPEALSTNLCSLRPEQDRLCLVCELTLASTGERTDYRFYEAIIHSRAKLTYVGVEAVLDSGGAEPTTPTASTMADHSHEQCRAELELLQGLYQRLRTLKGKRGALEIDVVEAEFVFNSQGQCTDIQPRARGDAHKIVEECMILANVCAAEFCAKHKLPLCYRVHEPPEPVDHLELARFLRTQGISLSGKATPKARDYQQALERINARPDGRQLSLQLLRAMRRATYQVDDIGHFGLALETYTHFTSPIRRYADLIVHRAIKVALAPDAQQIVATNTTASSEPLAPAYYSTAQLRRVASAVNVASQNTEAAARFAGNWLRCVVMQDKLGALFTGVVVGVQVFGLFVEIESPYVQGMVHISDLGRDYFNYDANRMCLVGRRTGREYGLGDLLRVKLATVEQMKGRLCFVPAETRAAPARGQAKRRSSKRKPARRR